MTDPFCRIVITSIGNRRYGKSEAVPFILKSILPSTQCTTCLKEQPKDLQ